jgi:hypothetical protein
VALGRSGDARDVGALEMRRKNAAMASPPYQGPVYTDKQAFDSAMATWKNARDNRAACMARRAETGDMTIGGCGPAIGAEPVYKRPRTPQEELAALGSDPNVKLGLIAAAVVGVWWFFFR